MARKSAFNVAFLRKISIFAKYYTRFILFSTLLNNKKGAIYEN